MSQTYNQAIDYFGLETTLSNSVKVTSSSENRSMQTSTGPNTYGDIVAVDAYGDTAAPQAEYQVIGDVDDKHLVDAGGSLKTVVGMTGPVVFGSLSFSTSNGSAPTMSASGQMVQQGAVRLRKYTPIAFKITARHRAQNCIGTWDGSNFVPAVIIKKGSAVASDITDYGLESVSGDLMPIELTTGMPKGVLRTYDIHGGTATISYSMNWYASVAPTIELSEAAQTAKMILSAPQTKSDPENGYTQYTWSISVPMFGSEV